MATAIPVVEIADHLGRLRIGRPDGEINTLNTLNGTQLGTETVVDIPMATLTQEVKVIITHQRRNVLGSRHCLW